MRQLQGGKVICTSFREIGKSKRRENGHGS